MVKQTFGFLQNQTLKIREDGRQEQEDGTENTAHLKITSSVLLEIHCTQIIILDVMNFQNIQKNKTLRGYFDRIFPNRNFNGSNFY